METNGTGKPPPAAPAPPAAPRTPISPGMICALIIFGLLCASIAGEMMHSWKVDKALSHGPLVPFITLGLLYYKKDELKQWGEANVLGLTGLLGSTFFYVLAVWADVEFMKPLSLIGVALSAVYFLGGKRNFHAASGPLGFLVFLIPWPTSLTERLAFPLQMISTNFATFISGNLLGLNIEQRGVHLSVLNGPKTVYEVVVAQACSGLTSMMVLLALGYLIAYFTPIKLGWRALLMAVVIPLTLLCNSIRLSVILLFGAVYNPAIAKWVHDNEGPVLIFFCSIALMGIRTALVKWLTSNEDSGKDGDNKMFTAAEA